MTTYHLLGRPIERLPNGAVKWEALCGLKLALQPGPTVKPGAVVQTPDKQPTEVIECAGCYAGQEQGAPPQTQRPDREDEPQAPRRPPGEVDDPNFTQLGQDEIVEE